jgi:flagellar hook-basal body complex protein FliE
MSKIFYLTCVYLNYIQGSKRSTQIVVYSESQSFTGFPEQEFNRKDWNAKADDIHNMGDDSTPIDSR